jgi:hypothetical protein
MEYEKSFGTKNVRERNTWFCDNVLVGMVRKLPEAPWDWDIATVLCWGPVLAKNKDFLSFLHRGRAGRPLTHIETWWGLT